MTPERWHLIEEVFHAALHRGADERSRFLDAACAGNSTLRKSVEELIQAHDDPDSFLDNPAFEPMEPTVRADVIERSLRRAGFVVEPAEAAISGIDPRAIRAVRETGAAADRP